MEKNSSWKWSFKRLSANVLYPIKTRVNKKEGVPIGHSSCKSLIREMGKAICFSSVETQFLVEVTGLV